MSIAMKKGGCDASSSSSSSSLLSEDVLSLCHDDRLSELTQLVNLTKASRKHTRSSKDRNPLEALLCHSDPVEGRSLLHIAALEDQRKVVRYLLRLEGKNVKLVNHQDFAGWTALHGAASRGHLQTCRLLLEEGRAEAGLTSKDSATALHYLMKQTYPKEQKHLLRKVVEGMLKVGADLNAVNVNQETALHLACWKGDKRSASVLLELGASMVLFSKSGETCLHYAVRNGHLAVVQLLVQNGADVSVVGHNGSASDIALECQCFHIADYIDSFFTIRRLPDEMLLYVFSFLTSAKDLLHVTHVCKHFRRIGSEPILWKPFLAKVAPSKLTATSNNNDDDWKQIYLDHRKGLIEQREKRRKARAEQGLRPYVRQRDRTTSDCDFLLKLAIIGDLGVGKTSLATRMIDGTFTDKYQHQASPPDPKIGTLDLDNYKVKVQMWEPNLNPRFYGDNHNRYIYRGACGVLLCYDVTDRVSFENVRNWNIEVERYALEGVLRIMVATKVDVPPEFHAVTSEEARVCSVSPPV
ncbi:Signal recognition particle receptor beta subunit, variant 2 [Balamuthia mandrillaris]